MTPQDAHGLKHSDERHHAAAHHSKRHTARGDRTEHGAQKHRTPGQCTAPKDTTQRATAENRAKRKNAAHNNTTPGGTSTATMTHHSTPPKHDTRSHQDPPGDNRVQPVPTAITQTQQATKQNTGQRRRAKSTPHREQRCRHTGTAPHKEDSETETARGTTERQGTT